MFQSTPDYLNRENPPPPSEIGTTLDVSIHSRLFKPGEWWRQYSTKNHTCVSIHSRLFKPGEYLNTVFSFCINWFQSTPDYLNRENLALWPIWVLIYWFQSTPDYLNRENFVVSNANDNITVFQSTPDYLNRENMWSGQFWCTSDTVSIHSRLFKPGELRHCQIAS